MSKKVLCSVITLAALGLGGVIVARNATAHDDTAQIKAQAMSSIYTNKIKLNDGNEMPQLGIGTFNDPDDETARQAVLYALQNGVRMIDTAHAYNDERGVGPK